MFVCKILMSCIKQCPFYSPKIMSCIIMVSFELLQYLICFFQRFCEACNIFDSLIQVDHFDKCHCGSLTIVLYFHKEVTKSEPVGYWMEKNTLLLGILIYTTIIYTTIQKKKPIWVTKQLYNKIDYYLGRSDDQLPIKNDTHRTKINVISGSCVNFWKFLVFLCSASLISKSTIIRSVLNIWYSCYL